MKLSVSLALVLGLFGCAGDGEPLRVAGQRSALASHDEATKAWGVGNGRADTLGHWGVGNGRADTLGHWGVGNGRTDIQVTDPAGQVLEGALDVSSSEKGTVEVTFAPEQPFTLPGSYRLERPDGTADLATFELSDETLDDANAHGEVIVVVSAP